MNGYVVISPRQKCSRVWGQQKRNNSEFLPIAPLTLTGIVQASGKKQHILASVVLYSQCVRARTDKQQAAEWNRSVSLCTPTQGSFLAFQTAAGN